MSIINGLIDHSPPQRTDSCSVRLPPAGNRSAAGDVRHASAPGQGPGGNQTQPVCGAHRGAGLPGTMK